jgi:hypothetical protein
MKALSRVCLLLAVISISGASALEAAPCLEIVLREQGDRLTLSAAGAASRPNRSAKAISREFRTIYETLEKNSRLAAADSLIEKLSQELLRPLAGKIGEASCVAFQIRPGQMHFALDLLSVNGAPLFTQKPVGYSFKSGVDFSQQVVNRGSKGLIVRDPDTDPQDGAKMAHGFFPESKLLFMKQTNLRVFSGGKFDFILISGHGGVTMPWDASDDSDDDSIGFNDDELTADVLGKARYKLVYLDSCQLGMSHDFLEASRDAGAKYFLAPIISNEAGNSSTKTIKYFFGALRDGQTPIDALFTARKKLYNEFKGKPREKLLYYAFPFRIYGL